MPKIIVNADDFGWDENRTRAIIQAYKLGLIHTTTAMANMPWFDRAIEMGCQKVQLFKPYFDQAMIDKAHAHGIKCNVFWSDDPEEAVRFLDMGIDTILSNDYNRVAQAVRAWKRKKGLI